MTGTVWMKPSMRAQAGAREQVVGEGVAGEALDDGEQGRAPCR